MLSTIRTLGDARVIGLGRGDEGAVNGGRVVAIGGQGGGGSDLLDADLLPRTRRRGGVGRGAQG